MNGNIVTSSSRRVSGYAPGYPCPLACPVVWRGFTDRAWKVGSAARPRARTVLHVTCATPLVAGHSRLRGSYDGVMRGAGGTLAESRGKQRGCCPVTTLNTVSSTPSSFTPTARTVSGASGETS